MASSRIDHQVKEITKGFSSCSIDDHQKTIIESELKLLDIHFNWNLHQQTRPDGANPELLVSELNRKLKEMLDNSEFTFKSFCCQLTMAQELIKYDTDSALIKVLECEPWVMSLKTDTCQERDFVSISEALDYIYLGCKAFALFKCGFIAETKKVLQQVPDLKYMEEKQRSGIYGVKACAFMEYGLPGFLKALEYISIARSKYPTMAEWHFLTGKLMSRIRHIKFPYMTVSDEEENFYRTAYKLDENEASYALYVAQITREKAYSLFIQCRYDREAYTNSLERIDRMNSEALSLYTKLIQSNQNDSYILGRCAFGMMKLPEPYKCIDLAVKAIDQALKISPDNPLVNHYAGLIYHRHLKDNVKGWKYLERAASKNNYQALLDWLRLKYLMDPENYDPLPELNKALEYNDFVAVTLTEIGSWYFFRKLDVFCAWNHLKKVTDEHFVKNHISLFLNMRNKCDLFEVIFDEVKLKLSQGKYRNEQEKETLMSMSNELQALCPQSHPTDYSDLKSIILKQSDRSTRSNAYRNCGRGGSKAGAGYMQRGRGAASSGNWRTSSENIRSLDRNSSSICTGREKTVPWRDTQSRGQEKSVGERTGTSRNIISSERSTPNKNNCSVSEKSESQPASNEEVSARNISTENRKMSLNWDTKRHKKPLYFPKSGSQASNFTNKF